MGMAKAFSPHMGFTQHAPDKRSHLGLHAGYAHTLRLNQRRIAHQQLLLARRFMALAQQQHLA